MASLAHLTPRPSQLRGHLGTYLVGVGATTALTAGVAVVFLSMAAFVSFNGLPSFGGSSDDAGAAYLESSTSAAPSAAATALGAGRGAVAKDPVPGAHRGSASFAGGSGGGDSSGRVKSSSGGGSSSGGSSSGGGSTDPGGGGSTNPGGPGAISPSGPAPSIPAAPAPPIDVPSAPNPPGGINPPPIDVPSAPNPPSAPSVPNVPNLPSTSGSLSGAVQRVDNAAGTNLSGPTSGVTRAVDGVATGL